MSFISIIEVEAQLGFCQGNSGDPIFTETFGSGLQDTALPAGSTTYTYANGQDPDDGLYTVTSNTNYFDWLDVDDRTIGDTNGRMLLVNSQATAGEFFRTDITGLCENTTYEFSSWLINLSPLNGFCGAGVIPINVRFEIWDNTDTNLLASGDTGNITSTNFENWNQYALVFQSLPGQTSIILKMINNGAGGCGNDLAIDDILFKSCGDLITVQDSNSNGLVAICSSETPYSETLTAIPDFTVFNNHFYQWQTSTDGVNWSDVAGETNSSILITGITTTTYYRTKVAEFAANLNNVDCLTFSDVYEVVVNQAPPPPTVQCWETVSFDIVSCSWQVTGIQPQAPTDLECWETTAFNNSTCSWDVTGSQPLQPTIECWESATFNTISCSWDVVGTQPQAPTGLACWQTTSFNNATCTWDVSGTLPEEPQDLLCWQSVVFNDESCDWEITGTQPIEFRDEFVMLCQGEDVLLTPLSLISNPVYQWDSGEISQSILISNAGNYEVEVSNGCNTEIITFIVTEIETPIIESIVTNNNSIIVNLTNTDDYLFSIDGVNYQTSNFFLGFPPGRYTIFVKPTGCNTAVSQDYFHFYIQKFMTPNFDGKNDFFTVDVTPYFARSEIYIYNRYGKLLYSAINRNVFWDGTFNNKRLPTSDYWYRIVLDTQEFVGHFTLKR